MTRDGDDAPPFLIDGGEMGARMRGHDWSSSPLGPPAGWPDALRTLTAVMLGSHQPMFVAWGDARAMLYNDGYATLLGGKHPDALGRPFKDVWYEIMDDVGPILERAFAGEGTQMDDIAFTMLRNGYPEEAHFSFSYTPVRGAGGAVAGMFCACTETTAMVLAERRRISEAERLRQFFHHAPSFMAVLRGPDHVFEMANAAYVRLVGSRDLIGKPVRDAIPEVAGQGFIDLIDEVYRSGEAFGGRGVRVQLEREPGCPPEERLLDFVYQPIIDADGRVDGIFVDGYDVTDRHQAETALRESEQRFRLIADSAPVPMWVTKMDRSRGFVNQAYADFLGVSYDEALHFDWRGIIHADDAERLVSESVAGEARLTPFVLEARYRRGDGAWRWLRSESQPRWGSDGQHIGFIGVAHDITESREAEAALRQINETLEKRVAERTADLRAALERLQAEVSERVRAEDALRQAQKMEAVGQLTGGIAHDFNNLLTPIMGGLEIIASRVENERLKRIAETALESSRRGAKLTGQLLAFSRIQRIAMAPVAVNAVIARMRDLLRHSIGAGIAVEMRLAVDALHGVCDANQLENAILNLAINARDAMPDGGTLTISTGRTNLPDGPDIDGGPFISVSVGDTGTGMADDVIARATEPFFSTKPVGKGTGLGLAQVYGIARQSGGTVRIDSILGEGTTVHLLLPEVAGEDGEAEDVAAGSETEEAAAAGGATILVIDDDADVRDFLIDTLEGLGHRAVPAASGEEGLKLVAAAAPDLILLDYAMPGMHGAEVAQALRATHPRLPVIFVTGYAESSQIAALGPEVSVLRKPFGLAELAAMLAERLAQPEANPSRG